MRCAETLVACKADRAAGPGTATTTSAALNRERVTAAHLVVTGLEQSLA